MRFRQSGFEECQIVIEGVGEAVAPDLYRGVPAPAETDPVTVIRLHGAQARCGLRLPCIERRIKVDEVN
jgi:hypothetical protein